MSSDPAMEHPLEAPPRPARASRAAHHAGAAIGLLALLGSGGLLYGAGAPLPAYLGGALALVYLPAFGLFSRDRWSHGVSWIQLTLAGFAFGCSLLLPGGAGFGSYLLPLAVLPWVALSAEDRPRKILFAIPLVAYGIQALLPASLASQVAAIASQTIAVSTLELLRIANPQLALLLLLGAIWKLHGQVGQTEAMLAYERRRFFGLMMEMMPQQIALQLLSKPGVLAEQHPSVTVLFADLVGFTSWAAKQHPVKVVTVLNWIFSRFDQACEVHGVTKIKTIGDCYMAAAGLPIPNDGNTPGVAHLALSMREILTELCRDHKLELKLRIGIHMGPVVAGVIGERGYRYDLWGDSVNVASRMESHGQTGRIQVSKPVFERLEAAFKMTPRGEIAIKGKQGKMSTWWLEDAF